MKVQSTNNNYKDYLKAGAFGVVSGYALKNALPLSEFEKAETYTDDVLKKLSHINLGAKSEEFNAILEGVKGGSENIKENVLDVFVKNKENILNNNLDAVKKNASSLDNETKEGLFHLVKRVVQSGKDAEEVSKKSFEALTKSSRPAFYFVALASAVVLSLAVLRNSLKVNMQQDSENSLDVNA